MSTHEPEELPATRRDLLLIAFVIALGMGVWAAVGLLVYGAVAR